MGTTYEYTYDYEVTDTNKHNRANAGGNYTQRSTGPQSQYGASVPPSSRTNPLDPLANLQHDRIWHKLYDPLNIDKASHEAEVQKMARRQDRKVIKIEAAYGSDRQTLIIKRNYDLRVRDVQEDAVKVFKMPLDQIILYWKGRNICDTPNELLETLGIENNHQMRVCRSDDPVQRERQRQSRSYSSTDQFYSSSNDPRQPAQYPYYSPYQQPVYSAYPTGYDQQTYNTSPRTNYYQQLTNPIITGPVAATYVLNLQVGFGDRVESLIIGRAHPITIYDLQMELQQRFNLPVLEQNISYNGMSLGQFPLDAPVETAGIVNNSFISLWYRNTAYNNPQLSTDYYSPRQPAAISYYTDSSQLPRENEMATRRMDSRNSMNESIADGGNQEVLKIEVFHGSDRHVLILRSTNNLRIIDLMEELQRITTVPIFNQKLYFRGLELQLMKDRTLRETGIDNNAQVRLIGEPTKVRYEPMITANRAS